MLKRTWATWPFGSSSLASTAMSAASVMVEMIDVVPIFGVQSVAAAETDPSSAIIYKCRRVLEYQVGNTSGARGPHGKDVETIEKFAPQSA
jgi:hypothetical protein